MIRQPIITICGHVDHGKTSILDKIRGSSVASKEAGGITQRISFTLFPADHIKKKCYLLDKYNIALQIPGFLFIDTPGHQAFTNLRKRGGSLADIAILVIDINDGIMPQTAEVLQILKQNKTPFIVALNKVDSISGWRKVSEDMRENIEGQAAHTTQDFQEKFYKIVSALDAHKFKSDLFYEVKDFTSKIALVPCSAKTGEGIPELMMILCGLSQKFLSEQLSLGEKAKGVIFEIKKEKTQNYIEAILYDGKLKQGDEIAIASFSSPIISKIRAMEEICPLCEKFENKKEVSAATGIRIQLSDTKNILPGMPFHIYKGDMGEIEKEFKKEIGQSIQTDEEGIIIKADSLGSLEALMILLKQSNVNVMKAGIGNINKSDITSAKANIETNPLYSVILGFNVEIDEDAKEIAHSVKIFSDEVVYKLIENLSKWQEEKRKSIEKEKMMGLASISKSEILKQYVFRNSSPAIFGVKMIGGKLKAGARIIDENNIEIGKLKAIQSENKGVEEATSGMEVAVSIPGIAFDRQLKNSSFLYTDISERQFREFKKNKDLLNSDEIRILQEIAEIKRKINSVWGV
ncbi:translation initiation factor IF-2 [Candidatus Pacearchaeota archaeon]|nr:translation initiation factor IF-2 [Candidatus Pacearchaeota archaeon]